MKDVELHGQTMKEGDFVLLGYGAASRDPRVIENPGQIDISRETVLHAAFGKDGSRAVSADLARMVVVLRRATGRRSSLKSWISSLRFS